ncbi:AAA family ATPase [Ralstonia sp. 1138]|uniref:AAA family ATPase n=1 Tax=Ralstonia sp. 1138 TaxID=3156423 RepID=UPI00339367FB
MKGQEKSIASVNIQNSFEKWLSERHKWLQTAASRMISTKVRPDSAAIHALADLCLAEAARTEGTKFEVVAPGSLAQAAAQPKIHLRKLSDVTGVNAIKEGATLDFGVTGLTVVYGTNGSGKTGYSRLIKQICGSRAKEDLLGNVFRKQQSKLSARVHLRIGESEESVEWSPSSGAVPKLRHVHLFDSSVASLYFGQKNEATYEPSRMRFVSSLIKICDEVSSELSERKNKLLSKLPKPPQGLESTSAVKWLNGLKAGIKQEEVEVACKYTPEMDSERIAGEAALAEKDIPGRLRAIERETRALNSVREMVEGWKTSLGDEALGKLVAARADALHKRKLATEDASKVFADAPLEGVGQDLWRQLWEKAREFSTAHAYKGRDYPQTDDQAKCVLCQQILEPDAKKRMQHFEEFVKSSLEKDAEKAENLLKDLSKKLPALPDQTAWIASASSIKIDEATAIDWFKSLEFCREEAGVVVVKEGLPSIDWSIVDKPIGTVSAMLAAEKKALLEMQEDGKRKQLAARVNELLGSQWINRELESIREEIGRLNAVAAIDRAISLTSTAILTKKNNELSEQELKSGYQERFFKELKDLNGDRLPVEPRSRQQGKGKVTFSLCLKNAGDEVKADLILSEGERRIISLAAFLADISGSGQPTPFVFDDPISSLDQDFEEHVVERLVRLAEERQVIIFTHRLSLLALVESAVKKLREQALLEKKDAPVELHTTSLRRLGDAVGLVADVSIREAKPEKALNRLREETLKQLRKLHDAADVEGYEERVKSFCSDFRILVERCVETVLLNDVLVRFRRSITTQGRIGALSKIEAADCSMIDDLMTRYSVFEHSQSSELPAQSPSLEVLEKDADMLAQWIKDFGARAAT